MNNIVIALIGGILGMLGYGISDFFAKKTIDKIGSIKSLFYSQIFAAVFIAIYLFKDPTLPNFSLKNVIYLIFFGLAYAAGYLSLYKAFEIGKVSVISPITSTFAVLAAIVSYFLFKEPFSTLKIISLIFVIVGIVLTAVNFKEFKNKINLKELLKGVPQAIIVFIVFGFYFPLWGKFVSGNGWAVWVSLVKIILACFVLVYSITFKKESVKFKPSKFLIFWLAFIGFFEALAYFGNSWALNITPENTSIIVASTSTYPLVTVILAYTILKEKLAINQYIGIGFIILGLVLMPFI